MSPFRSRSRADEPLDLHLLPIATRRATLLLSDQNGSSSCGGGLAGAGLGSSVSRPRWERMRSITSLSVIAEIHLRQAPRTGHFKMSTAKTRASRSRRRSAPRSRSPRRSRGGTPRRSSHLGPIDLLPHRLDQRGQLLTIPLVQRRQRLVSEQDPRLVAAVVRRGGRQRGHFLR